MVNRVPPIQPKPFGTYSTRHTFRFVHRKTSAISRSRFNQEKEGEEESPLSSVLLFARSGMLKLLFPLFLTRYLACRESRGNSRSKVHPRTEFPGERLRLSFLAPPFRPLPFERARSGSGVGNLRATDFAPRLPLGPTEVEGRSSVRRGSRYLD